MIKNKKTKKRVDKKSTQNKIKYNGQSRFEEDIIIGIPNDGKVNKKKKNLKKVKKLSEKQIRKRKVIFKIFKIITILILAIVAVIAIMISPIFNIKNINVKNNNKLSQDQIISLSEVKINDNIFKYSKKNIITKIKENAYVENVKISRILPDTIQIEIKERNPKLMILYGNAYVYVNSQGYILEVSQEKLELPIVKGYKTKEEDIVAGKRLCNEDLEKLATIIKILNIAKTSEMYEKITVVDIEDSHNYKLILEQEQKTAYIGDCSMLEERMLWLKQILEEVKEIPGEIFINMNLNTDRPYFRERV